MSRKPFGGPEHVLHYLARYTHRVAISNHRLIGMEDGKVTFRWKDYAHGGKKRKMTLAAEEFIRRFLLHVLPKGLVRIRHYGWMANRCRRERAAACRALLAAPPPATADGDIGQALPCVWRRHRSGRDDPAPRLIASPDSAEDVNWTARRNFLLLASHAGRCAPDARRVPGHSA